jgi:L-2,4-diaminobutyrate decarboxylase
VAELCAEHGLWMHVDGAHGASALLSPAERHRLAGIERADSVVWDAHKMLGTSTLCAAVLLRDVRRLSAAFRQEASYLIEEQPSGMGVGMGVDLITRTVECTKASLGLKLFLVLAVEGEAGLAARLETLYANARGFAARIAARPGWELLCEPEANIVCFRRSADSDARTAARRAALVEDGRVYLTQADVGGRRWLRLSVMNPLTDAATIDRLLETAETLPAR